MQGTKRRAERGDDVLAGATDAVDDPLAPAAAVPRPALALEGDIDRCHVLQGDALARQPQDMQLGSIVTGRVTAVLT